MKTLNQLFITAILTVTMALSTVLQAREANDFYSATVPVGDHSDGARSRAVQLGMVEVLIRLTGVSDVASRPEARDMLANVNAYVVEYSYATLDSKDGDLGLKVQYDRTGVDRFLRARGLPIWPLNRPRILVWLVADSPLGETAFVTAAQAEAVQRSLSKAFDRRGMPVVYPRYDLQDQQGLPPEKALSFDTDAIAQASARYPVEGWLVVRLHQPADALWRGAWVMGRADQTMLREVEAVSLEEMLQVVVDQTVDTVAANFSYVARKTADQVEIDVQGVNSFRAYNNLIGALEDMSIIRNIEVKGLDGDHVQLVLAIEGERTHLMDSLYRYPGFEALNPDGTVRSKEVPLYSGASAGVDPLNPAVAAADLPPTGAVDAAPDSPAAGMDPPGASAAIPEVEGVQHLRWIGGR